MSAQLQDQNISLQAAHRLASITYQKITSVIAYAANVLGLVASGVMALGAIAQQLRRMLEICVDFTLEMRVAAQEIIRLFRNLQPTLQRIGNQLLKTDNPPIVQFTDALGETTALPYQICQQWSTFEKLLGVIFIDKPRKARVYKDRFVIVNA